MTKTRPTFLAPTFLASDLEGVLIPEIWVAVGATTGIPELALTTRDIADYGELMGIRLRALKQHKLTIRDVQNVIAAMEPLPGAVELIQWIREQTRFVIITDSFYDFLAPFNAKLGYPTIFAHSLQVDSHGAILGYQLRLANGKRRAIAALKEIGFRVMAFGDSYNDTAMLAEADLGVLFKPPANVVAEFPHFPVAEDYATLRTMAADFLGA